jgi:cytosine/uracil/thiamine/allantoin permease
MNITYINGLVTGHLLVTWAIVLNLLAGNKIGVAFAILSIASAYALETIRGMDYSDLVDIANKFLVISMFVSVLLSYISWLCN